MDLLQDISLPFGAQDSRVRAPKLSLRSRLTEPLVSITTSCTTVPCPVMTQWIFSGNEPDGLLTVKVPPLRTVLSTTAWPQQASISLALVGQQSPVRLAQPGWAEQDAVDAPEPLVSTVMAVPSISAHCTVTGPSGGRETSVQLPSEPCAVPLGLHDAAV